MSNFKNLAEKEMPMTTTVTSTVAKEEVKKTSATANIDEFVNGLKKKNKNRVTRKRETERLGFTVDKELYNKLKTLSWNSGESVAKITSKILEEALTGVKVDDVDEFLVKNSVMTQASSYFILKPTEGKKDAVKDAMDKYMETLEENWKTYLPDQYELVKNRLEEEYGDYLVYIISTDNELVYKTIKK